MAEKRILIIEDDMHAAEVTEAYLKESALPLPKSAMVLKG